MEDVRLTSTSDRERQMLCGIVYMWDLTNVKFVDTEFSTVAVRGWGRQEMGRCCPKAQSCSFVGRTSTPSARNGYGYQDRAASGEFAKTVT